MGFVRKRLRPGLMAIYLLAVAFFVLAQPTQARLFLGAGLALLGELLRVWATGHLHKNDTLTITGPYRFLRHPLYLGTLFIGSGFAVMGLNVTTLGLAALLCLLFFAYYLPYKERIEGARLEELYGEDFRRYSTAVPKLLPRFHPYVPLGAQGAATLGWRWERFTDNNELGTGAVVVVGFLAMVARWGLS